MHKAEGLLTVQRPESTLSGKSPLIRLAQEIETRWAATQKQGKKRNETNENCRGHRHLPPSVQPGWLPHPSYPPQQRGEGVSFRLSFCSLKPSLSRLGSRPGGIFRARLPRFPTTSGLCEFCLLRLPLRRLADTSGGHARLSGRGWVRPNVFIFLLQTTAVLCPFTHCFFFCRPFSLLGCLRNRHIPPSHIMRYVYSDRHLAMLPLWFSAAGLVLLLQSRAPPDSMVCAQDADLSYIFP